MISPELEQRVRRAFAKQGFMTLIGAELTHLGEGSCHMAVPFRESVSQQHGFFHGGITATLADNAAGIAGYTLMDADRQPLSVEFKINLMAPARGERLEARAQVVRNGYRLKHVSVEIFARTGDEQVLVAMALATIASTGSMAEKPDT